MSRYRRSTAGGTTYFFTVNTYLRQPILTHPEVRSALREAIDRVRVCLGCDHLFCDAQSRCLALALQTSHASGRTQTGFWHGMACEANAARLSRHRIYLIRWLDVAHRPDV